MDITGWIKSAKDFGTAAFQQATGVIGAGAGFVSTAIGKTRLFASTESSASYDHQQVDEKHYFLVPDKRSPHLHSLYVMRCLPSGVPPINDLPKRRLFHLPNHHALPTLEQILLEDARSAAESTPATAATVSQRLNDIADQIDKLDGKVFNGVLLIGGLVALINPLAGAAVAAKALIPGVGMLLSKYGLKYASDTASSVELASRIKTVEKEVLKQFQGSEAESLVNPLLAQWQKALDSNEEQYEPILDFSPESMSFGRLDRDRLFRLTCQAITNSYESVLHDRSQWQACQLGPEDIRYLTLLKAIADDLPSA
ncbi:MAG: hypothetical protein R3C28_00210 [Pirellulaceae bacterium]